MMPRCMRAWLALICSAAGFAATTPPAATPLFVLWQHPAEAVPIDEPPLLAIYDDGTAIGAAVERSGGAANAPGKAVWLTRSLPSTELGNWYEDIFSILKDEELRSRYSIDPSGTAVAATFHFQAAGRSVQVTVRGLWSGALSPFGQPLNRNAEEVPARLLRMYQDAIRIGSTYDQRRQWNPTATEVRFEPLRGTAAPALRWPETWPQPARDSGGATITVTGPEVGAVRELLPMRRGGVLVGEAAMLAIWRPIFPGEAAWREPMRQQLEAAQAAATLARQNARAAEAAEASQRVREQASQLAPAITPALPAPAPAVSQPTLAPLRPELPGAPSSITPTRKGG